MSGPAPAIKCVAWDLDETVWPGIVLERPGMALPDVEPDVLELIERLEARGVLNSVASRNPPSLRTALERHPQLSGRLVAPQLGWGTKLEALRRIADALDIEPSSIALVDNDPFERASVTSVDPQLRAFSIEELAQRLEDPGFAGGVPLTEEARRRTVAYRQREQRDAAAGAFAGSHEQFLRSCEIRIAVGPARPQDAARVSELAARTTQYNSTGRRYTESEAARRAGSPVHRVLVARLSDRFGDDGLVGAIVLGCGEREVWRSEVVMVSCRAAGRGVVSTLLGVACRLAERSSAVRLEVPCRLTERNLPLRVSLRELGFRGAGGGAGAGEGPVVFARSLAGTPAPLPAWVEVEDLTL